MYRQFHTSTWDDPRIRALPPHGKLLWAYLITNRHTHVSGLYYIPRVLIQRELGLEADVVDTLLDTLSKARLISLDWNLDLIWVRNFMKYQGKGDKNARSAGKHLGTLHNSPLVHDFCDCYPHVAVYVEGMGSDRVSDRVSAPRLKDQEKEKEKETPPTPSRGNGSVEKPKKKRGPGKAEIEAFQACWNEHRGKQPLCRRVGKEREKLIKRALATESDLEAHAAGIRAFASNDFARAEGHTIDTYCRHHEKWLDAEGQPASKGIESIYDTPGEVGDPGESIFDRISHAQNGGTNG